jgi:hypothetical protein
MKHLYLYRISRLLLIPVVVSLPLFASGDAISSHTSATTASSIAAGPGARVPTSMNRLPSTQLSTLSNSPTAFYNWSGYAATATKPFNKVQTTFIQPRVTCTTPGAWTLFWVGFDGFQNGTVEQVGTAAQCPTAGVLTPTYYIWWEMYPTMSIAPDYSVPINPGDSIRASVFYSYKNANYVMTVTNLTTSKTMTHIAACGSGLVCARNSAEWIVERPATNGVYTPLAKWGTGTMKLSQAQASVSTTYTVSMKPVSAYSNTPINMVDYPYTGKVLATIGALNSTGNQFTDTWKAAQ